MINDFVTKEDLALFTSGSRFNLAAVFHQEKMLDDVATFDLFVREMPKNRNYLVFGGMEHVAEYLLNLSLTKEQLEWIQKSYDLSPEVIAYFRDFKFTGDMYAMPEGTIFFPNEPIIRISAPIVEAQLIEMCMINMVFLQTILASKISRFINAANGKDTTIGHNRSYGTDAAMKAVRVEEMLGAISGLPAYHYKHGSNAFSAGTFHYLIMAFENEIDAMKSYLRHMKGKGYVLIDTYDSIQGIKNFIKAAKELEVEGISPTGIQLDSGDLYDLSVTARKMLDKAGLNQCKIFAMSNLDEYKVHELEMKKAPIDVYAGTTNILTPCDDPIIELVYKLSEIEKDGKIIPKMKTATNKVSYPGKKQVHRIKKDGYYKKDVISLDNELIDGEKLLQPIIKQGRLVYEYPNLGEIKKYYRNEISQLPKELLSVNKSANYNIEISPGLKELAKRTRVKLEKDHQA